MYRFGSGGSLLGLVMAAVIAGGVGAVISLPALRLRGLYLALLTMALASLMDNAFFPWSAVFGFDGSVPIHKPDLFGLNLSSDKVFTIFLAVVFALLSIAILALRRGPFGRVLVAAKDSEAACATLGLSLTTTKLVVFTLSAAMAGVAGALFGAAEAVAGGTNFEMFESLLILAVVAIGGASVCSGALAGGLAVGFLPGNAQDVFIGAGTVALAFYPDGVLPLAYSRFHQWWSGSRRPAARRHRSGQRSGPVYWRATQRRDAARRQGRRPAGRDCRNPRQRLSLNPCHVGLRPARQRHAWDSHSELARGSACPQSPSSSARDGRPR
jgi:branched-subunit amino acid ABC-type transport system permease component